MAKTKHEPALVLRGDHVVAERTYFPGFPGVFFPGEPVLLSSVGMTEQEARERITELGLPLELTEVADEEGAQTPAKPEQPVQGDTTPAPEED